MFVCQHCYSKYVQRWVLTAMKVTLSHCKVFKMTLIQLLPTSVFDFAMGDYITLFL